MTTTLVRTSEYALRDGTRVVVRPILPEDRRRLRDGLGRLSERSRYYRFLGHVSRLPDRQLRYFTEVDPKNHIAWIALDPTDPELPLLGVARMIRLDGEPTVAEAAVTVVDSHQGRGLGTLLLGKLADSATRTEIRRFRAHVLAENTAMLHLFRDLGATFSTADGGIVLVDMLVPDDPRDLPETAAGRVFRAVARRELAFPWLESREPGA